MLKSGVGEALCTVEVETRYVAEVGKTVHYVNKAGRKIDEHLIRPGTRVIVYGARGQTHAAERVIVDED